MHNYKMKTAITRIDLAVIASFQGTPVDLNLQVSLSPVSTFNLPLSGFLQISNVCVLIVKINSNRIRITFPFFYLTRFSQDSGKHTFPKKCCMKTLLVLYQVLTCGKALAL